MHAERPTLAAAASPFGLDSFSLVQPFSDDPAAG
jgi:hypothetical protein